MRDPDRIPEILELVAQIWKKESDLRLGQLIFNATKLKDQNADVAGIEDEGLRKGLLRYLETLPD